MSGFPIRLYTPVYYMIQCDTSGLQEQEVRFPVSRETWTRLLQTLRFSFPEDVYLVPGGGPKTLSASRGSEDLRTLLSLSVPAHRHSSSLSCPISAVYGFLLLSWSRDVRDPSRGTFGGTLHRSTGVPPDGLPGVLRRGDPYRRHLVGEPLCVHTFSRCRSLKSLRYLRRDSEPTTAPPFLSALTTLP